jgi:hypothetical protein
MLTWFSIYQTLTTIQGGQLKSIYPRNAPTLLPGRNDKVISILITNPKVLAGEDMLACNYLYTNKVLINRRRHNQSMFKSGVIKYDSIDRPHFPINR